ncbi:MAG TPA: GAF domain-containing protein [Flavobacteriaceae bacterium]|nr:GAF domain-containing protein [Flavobacteriaceae bacterium]
MKKQIADFPIDIRIGFKKVIEAYEAQLKVETSSIGKEYLENILKYVRSFPKLETGMESMEELKKHQDAIKILLDDLFPDILTKNEIKAASVPFHNFIFNTTDRFSNILRNAGKDFKLQIRNLDQEMRYVYACVLILNDYYGYKIDFSRPLIYDIPDENGILKHYRLAMNADFIEIEPTKKAVEITQDDVDALLQDPDNIELWKEKFPPKSWIFNGFTILNLTDVTMDDGISDLKTALLNRNAQEDSSLNNLAEIFQSIYKIPDLRVGFTIFNQNKVRFRKMGPKDVKSFILNKEKRMDCKSVLCENAYRSLVEDHTYFSIANVDEYAKRTDHNLLSKNLLAKKVKSCILAPVAKKNELLGVLELVSTRKNELNSINAIKLEDVLPYIVTTLERNKSEFENRIKAVIQNECTSIHPSVLWIFEEEAKRFIEDLDEDGVASFRDISFNEVYPLYGQIDIVGSSDERNMAIQKDLTDHLNLVLEIIDIAYKEEPLPIYEQVKFRINEFIEDLKENLNASSEQKVLNLLKKEVGPIMQHIKEQSAELKKKVLEHQANIDKETGVVYNHRKNYDQSVQNINRTMARYIDRKQLEAQKIYPHYFERYKTDGVDHNMYIGKSMTRYKTFGKVYLYNLRLWQLQTMCEMENKFYQIQENAKLQLDAASLILVFNTTLSIRYRMDEKKFDIDGTYNARYEIIKKRIDKAFIKNTEERVTQKGKIAIIYAQKSDEREYLRYIKYLQAKKYLTENVELLDLEDVQGVIGLKALRVEVLYHKNDMPPEEVLTYEDLIKELH